MRKVTCDVRSCFFCRHILEEWREETLRHKESFVVRKGIQLIREGSPVTGMYMILDGAVKVHRRWGAGRELIVRFAGPGEIVGFRGIGAGAVYPISATAMTELTACFLPIEFLQSSLGANPGLTQSLMELFARELQLAEQRMSDLAHMDVKGRLAKTLLSLTEDFGADAAGLIHMPISRQDIASYSGTIYETVFKIFSEWSRQGWIRTEGKRIGVLNAEALAALIR